MPGRRKREGQEAIGDHQCVVVEEGSNFHSNIVQELLLSPNQWAPVSLTQTSLETRWKLFHHNWALSLLLKGKWQLLLSCLGSSKNSDLCQSVLKEGTSNLNQAVPDNISIESPMLLELLNIAAAPPLEPSPCCFFCSWHCQLSPQLNVQIPAC